jgi:uncharacterized protein (TIGR02118 family)
VVKLTLLYNPPVDAEAFDEYYLNTHVPIVERMPGIRRFEVAVVKAVRGGGDPPYHIVSEIWYDDEEALAAASASPEGQAAGADVANFPGHTGALALISHVAD